jgi:hypothetical protein
MFKHKQVHVSDVYCLTTYMNMSKVFAKYVIWSFNLSKHSQKGLDDPKLPSGSKEVPKSEWSGWRFDFRCDLFFILDKKNQLSR